MRIERELGDIDRWIVLVMPAVGCFQTTVTVHDADYTTKAVATGFDAALSIWDAMCRLEQDLREARSRRPR